MRRLANGYTRQSAAAARGTIRHEKERGRDTRDQVDEPRQKLFPEAPRWPGRISVICPESGKSTETERTVVAPGRGEEGEPRVAAGGHKVLFWGEEGC